MIFFQKLFSNVQRSIDGLKITNSYSQISTKSTQKLKHLYDKKKVISNRLVYHTHAGKLKNTKTLSESTINIEFIYLQIHNKFFHLCIEASKVQTKTLIG